MPLEDPGTSLLGRISLLLISGALVLSVRAGVPELDQAGEPVVCDVTGRVEGLGYSFLVPQGLKGCRIWPRSIYIPLGSHSEDRYILIDWSYNASMVNDIHEWFEEFAEGQVREKGYSLVRRQSQRLGGLHGERALFYYRDNDNKTRMALDFVEALSAVVDPDFSGPAYSYSAELVTPQSHYIEDNAVFERTMKTWRQEPEKR